MKPRTILLIDDDSDFLAVLKSRCQAIGLEVRHARNLLTAVTEIERRLPDVVCVDVQMPTGNGLQFCRMLRAEIRTAATPLVVLTGDQSPDTQIACQDMDAQFVYKSCDFWDVLEPALKQILCLLPAQNQAIEDHDRLLDTVFSILGANFEGSPPSPYASNGSAQQTENATPAILCIEDDTDFFNGLALRLLDLGFNAIQAKDGMSGYRTAFVSPVRAIMLDYMLPNGRGDYILSRLKDNPVTKDIPVIVLTGQRDKMLERRMLAMGAKAYLTKPIDFHSLHATLNTCLSA